MIVETDKYYMPGKNRVILLPAVWREEFNITENDLLTVCKKDDSIIIQANTINEVKGAKYIKINKKGVITIPKSIDEQLDIRLHQLFINSKYCSFFIAPVK
ncbi:looped-hinge helix DNA binding domain-containing protein, AbrB family [Bacillus sp. OV194]|uniref:hypothetical protein n=1 Tax=Fictibacillus sp. B-59209 TaxID=3024873 RepID=UPI0008EEA6BA|nr:hypothetical protein [Fictibacillus sp. B-59209]MED2972418.1 hypothetical protein [Fictibacillus sp. B-59209]SFD63775.1 looped-hinge helix DNA binding domain-containing protein, AbrB family [Bacillus sp. OV194]